MGNLQMSKERQLFAVFEVTPDNGDAFLYVDWHPDLMPVVCPDGTTTDKLLDIAEKLLAAND
jgi:hypothetical protein